MIDTKYIKSPLNYTGGKFKLLPQILPLFPKEISTFIDLFGGGFNVGININAEKIYYNDINLPVVKILESFSHLPTEKVVEQVEFFVAKYNLTKTNKEGYLQCREDFNCSAHKDYLQLYTLICYSFNNQIRFNSKMNYNMPFGKNKSSFNPILKQKLVDFCNMIHNKNCFFTNSDFRDYGSMSFDNKDVFIYCDPPYLNSIATYNENGGWSDKDEKDLLDMLIRFDKQGIKWAFSNNLTTNPQLTEFVVNNNYILHYLNNSYSNCSYHKKDKSHKDEEVLITNY